MTEFYNLVIKTFPDGHNQYHWFDKKRLAGSPDDFDDFYSDDWTEMADKADYLAVDDDGNIIEPDDDKPEKKSDSRTIERKKIDNMKRAINKVYDLAQSNNWDWFVTYTFSKEKVDRYDFSACLGGLKRHLRYLRDHACRWLIVWEQHEDGAYHAHGLIAGDLPVDYALTAVDGTDVFNVHGYSAGYSTATRIKDTKRASTYICKYITKECSVPPGQRRYLAARSLARPTLSRCMFYGDVDALIKGARFVKECASPYGNMVLIED